MVVHQGELSMGTPRAFDSFLYGSGIHLSKRLAFNEDALIGCCSDSLENEKFPLIDEFSYI